MPSDSPVVRRILTSPNGRMREAGEAWRYVVIHGTWMTSDEAALERLTDPAAEVSCHYYITRDGEVVQLVGEDRIAWHAGKSAWQGREMLNSCALGIEIGNAGPFPYGAPSPEDEANPAPEQWAQAEPYTEAQYLALIALLEDILGRHPEIGVAGVLGHSEVSPGRKIDPGAHFDWEKLAVAGVALPRPL